MLTDEQLSIIVNSSPCDGADVRCYQADFDRVITQAREANKLRSDLAAAQQLASLLGEQLAAQAPVVKAALREKDTNHSSLRETDEAVDTYRSWLASHPHATNAGTVTVQAQPLGVVSYRDGKRVEE